MQQRAHDADGVGENGGGGFSLMHALKGSASVASTGNATAHSDADSSTALLREGLALASPVRKQQQHSANHVHRRSPLPTTAAPRHPPAVPIRATKSFTSSSNYYNQQQQHRRPANYRHAPKKFSPNNHRRTDSLETHGSGSAANCRGSTETHGGGKWTFPGLSPNNSAESEERGTGGASLKATSFDDCYSSAMPGYHDAFALLDGVERGGGSVSFSNDAGGDDVERHPNDKTAAKPSPRSGGHALRNLFPSSPKRNPSSPNRGALKVAPSSFSPKHHAHPPQAAPAAHSPEPASTSTSGGGGTSPNQMIGSKENNYTSPDPPVTPPRRIAPPWPSGAPAPPSGVKRRPSAASAAGAAPKARAAARASSPTKGKTTAAAALRARAAARASSPSTKGKTTAARAAPRGPKATVAGTAAARVASPLRHSSPLTASRVRGVVKRTLSLARVGRHARSRSKGSGNYSDAVSQALREEGAAREVEIIADDGTGGRPPKSGGARSQEGTEVVSGPGTPRGGAAAGSARGRSPSPARLPGDVGAGKSKPAKSVASVESTNEDDSPNSKSAPRAARDPAAPSSAPSFFGIRNMSPKRMTRSLKKRLTAPAALTPPGRQRPPPREQGRRRGHLARSPPSPGERPLPSAWERPPPPRPSPASPPAGEGDGRGGGADPVASLAHTTMSFDVDDPRGSPANRDGNGVESAPTFALPPTPVQEGHEDDEGGYSIDTTSFNLFESHAFSRAMGGEAGEVSSATNYIQTGDGLCGEGEDSGEDRQRRLDRAVRAYYAGLGKILTRIREWLTERRDGARDAPKELLDVNGNYIPTRSVPAPSHVLYKDLLEIARAPETNVLLLAMSSALLRAGNAHFRRARYEEACRDYAGAQSYRQLRHEAGEVPPGVESERGAVRLEDARLRGRTSNNAASALSMRGMYEEARSEYARALQVKQGALEAWRRNAGDGGGGADDDRAEGDLVSDVASTFHNIGLLRMECGEPKKAEKAYKQSLSLRVKQFGLDDLGVSSTLRALGDLYYHLKQYDDAFRSYKESLRIWKSHSGKSDLKTAEHYYNIGLVFYSKGPLAKARTSVAECLRIRRLLCPGRERLPVAAALYLLGLIASSSGNHDEALSLLGESLAIRRDLLEPADHPLSLNAQLALGTAHRGRDDLEGAMGCFSEALAGRTRRLGRDHASVAEVLQAVGAAYSAAGEGRKAFATLEEALRIRRGTSPGEETSPEAAETLDLMGLVLFRSGDVDGAVELGGEALDALGSDGGPDRLLAGGALKNAGDYYQELGAYDDAVEAYGESLRVMTAWHGREHPFLSEVLNEIGVTRFKNGEYMIAKQSFTEALRLMRLTHNEANQSAIFPTLNHLGHALYKNNELNLAAETYIESFNIQVSIVTGGANDGLEEFGAKLNAIKERIVTMEREEDVAELSEALGGIASILRYLGLVIQEQGDFEAALTANKLSLSVRMCQPSKEQSAIALMAETIAICEYKRNNLASAMDYFNQALEAKRSYQGESTIDVARTVNNLANIHFSLGNLDDAMGLYQEALEIKRHCLGDDSDEVANTLNNIAHVMVNAGKEQEALSAYHNVVKIRQDRYGKSHVSVAATLASMGDVYIKLGKLEIAMTYFEQCIRIQKLRQDYCDERVLENLGSIYGKLGEWHKAESTFEEIIGLKRAAHGEGCLDVAKTLDLLAVSYIEQDRYAESIEHLQEALRIRKACLDVEDDEILASLNKLAFVYKSLDMTEQMLEVRKEFEALQQIRRTSC